MYTSNPAITDNSGKVLKQINVSGSGKGSVNIEGSSLAAGSYNYSLLIDGRIIDTNKWYYRSSNFCD